ncbi:MAG: LmeA family phospholipid-binding protein [Armatimonadota bacterium]
MKKAVLLGAAVLILAGCGGGLIRPKVEKGIRNALPDYIGPAKSYKVKANGSEASMIGGKIDNLHIEGEDVQIDRNLTVDQMIIDMESVRFHTSTREVKSVKNTVFKVMLSEDTINRYIENNRKDDSNLRIKFNGGKVVASITSSLLGISLPVSVEGKPSIKDGALINFSADSVSVAHLPFPSFIINKILNGINPILDMSTMKFPIKLQDIIIENNYAVINGNAQFKNNDD